MNKIISVIVIMVMILFLCFYMLEERRKEIAILKSSINKLDSEKTQLESDIAELESNIAEIESNITKMESNITVLKTKLEQKYIQVYQKPDFTEANNAMNEIDRLLRKLNEPYR